MKVQKCKKPYIERISTCQVDLTNKQKALRNPRSITNVTQQVKQAPSAFRHMKFGEIKKHEHGIMNIYESTETLK